MYELSDSLQMLPKKPDQVLKLAHRSDLRWRQVAHNMVPMGLKSECVRVCVYFKIFTKSLRVFKCLTDRLLACVQNTSL